MRYSGVPGRKCFDGAYRSELIMSKKIDILVFVEYLDQDICLERANNERSIVNVVRRDASIRITVLCSVTSVTWRLGNREKRVQKTYQDVLSKHLVYAVQ